MKRSNVLYPLLVCALVFGCQNKRASSPATPTISIQVDVTEETPALGAVDVAGAMQMQLSGNQESSSAKSDFFLKPIVLDRAITGYNVGFLSLGLAEISISRNEAGTWIVGTNSDFKGDIYTDVLFRKDEKRVRFKVLPGKGVINLGDRTNVGATQRE